MTAISSVESCCDLLALCLSTAPRRRPFRQLNAVDLAQLANSADNVLVTVALRGDELARSRKNTLWETWAPAICVTVRQLK